MLQDGTGCLLHQHLALAVLLLLVPIGSTKQPIAKAYQFLHALLRLDNAVDKDVCGMDERCQKCNVLLKLCAWQVSIFRAYLFVQTFAESVCSSTINLVRIPSLQCAGT